MHQPASSTTTNFWIGAVSRNVPRVKRFKSSKPTFFTVAMTSAALLSAGARVTSKPAARLSRTAALANATRVREAEIRRILRFVTMVEIY